MQAVLKNILVAQNTVCVQSWMVCLLFFFLIHMKDGGKEWSSFSRPNQQNMKKLLYATAAVKSVT